MAENKKSFVLYCDLIHTIEKMPDSKAGVLLKHILRYVNDMEPVAEDLIIELTFEPIKQQLKRDLAKYEKIVNRNKSNGSLGGRPRKEPKKPNGFIRNPKEPKKPDSDNVNDNDNESVILLKKETKDIPEWIEFLTYGLEKEKSVDHSALKMKYEAWKANDWKDGNGRPIKNWKSTLLHTMPYIKKNNENGKSNTNTKQPYKFSSERIINQHQQTSVGNTERELSEDSECSIIE